MKLLTPATQTPLAASVVTIGTFDGVHLGHRNLLEHAKRRGDALGIPSVAITFNPHPATIVRGGTAPALINSFEERLALFEELGVDYCYLVEFDLARSQELASDFVKGTLVGDLGAKVVIVGPDFRFGSKRAGNVDLLQEMAGDCGFVVESDLLVKLVGEIAASVGKVLPELQDEGEVVVSSTLIRRLISFGSVELAHRLLGRDFYIVGLVTSGDGRGGSELGYPTANVSYQDNRVLPVDGVYAGWVQYQQSRYMAAVSVGTRPTYYPKEGNRLIEAFLLDFDGDLYGREIQVGFTHFLRPQKTFSNSKELVDQIELDVEDVKVKQR